MQRHYSNNTVWEIKLERIWNVKSNILEGEENALIKSL